MLLLESFKSLEGASSDASNDISNDVSLHHYIQCDPLWTLVISCTVNQVSLLHLSTAHKICLVNPNSLSISLCVVAFQVYHALRNTYSYEINLAVQQSDFSHIVLVACDLIINLAEAVNLR